MADLAARLRSALHRVADALLCILGDVWLAETWVSSALAISKPMATPPRGNARITGCRSFKCVSLPARRGPASLRSANFMLGLREPAENQLRIARRPERLPQPVP